MKYVPCCQVPSSAEPSAAQPSGYPVATPCRAGGPDGDGIPDIRDGAAPKPVAGLVRLSSDAIDARLRRVFRPNVNGQYKVGPEILKQWQSKKSKGRKNLEQLFQSCEFSPDWCCKIYCCQNLERGIGYPMISTQVNWGRLVSRQTINFVFPVEEAFIEECEVLRTELLENEVVVDGLFCTEKHMREELKWSERLASIIKLFLVFPFWIDQLARGSIC